MNGRTAQHNPSESYALANSEGLCRAVRQDFTTPRPLAKSNSPAKYQEANQRRGQAGDEYGAGGDVERATITRLRVRVETMKQCFDGAIEQFRGQY